MPSGGQWLGGGAPPLPMHPWVGGYQPTRIASRTRPAMCLFGECHCGPSMSHSVAPRHRSRTSPSHTESAAGHSPAMRRDSRVGGPHTARGAWCGSCGARAMRHRPPPPATWTHPANGEDHCPPPCVTRHRAVRQFRGSVGTTSRGQGREGGHQGQTNREGGKDIWWTARTAHGGTGHLGRTETQRGRLRTACGRRCVDSKNSQTTPATTSTTPNTPTIGRH